MLDKREKWTGLNGDEMLTFRRVNDGELIQFKGSGYQIKNENWFIDRDNCIEKECGRGYCCEYYTEERQFLVFGTFPENGGRGIAGLSFVLLKNLGGIADKYNFNTDTMPDKLVI